MYKLLTQFVCISFPEVPISMKIDMEFIAAYGDTASSEYANFVNEYITEVNHNHLVVINRYRCCNVIGQLLVQ